MDLDEHEEREVASQLFPDPGPPPGQAPSIGMWQALQRDIRVTVQESVQRTVQDTVGQALAHYLAAREQEAEDADDEATGSSSADSKRRKKTLAENNYHNVMRGWLAEKGVPIGDGPLPGLPSRSDVAAYVARRENGPRVDKPLFDWTVPFSHAWNDELLGLLAEEWIPLAEESLGHDGLADSHFELIGVKKILASKLRYTKKRFLRRFNYATGEQEHTEDTRKADEELKEKLLLRSRHGSRSSGTYLRRLRIVEYHLLLGDDPDFWQGVHILIRALGRKGMSSDESEEEPAGNNPYSRGRKIVRRIPKRWLNEQIARIWVYVEGCYRRLPPAKKRGNPPYERHYEAKKSEAADMEMPEYYSVVKQLPINWYDPVYWAALTQQAKKAVSSVAENPLPTIPTVSSLPQSGKNASGSASNGPVAQVPQEAAAPPSGGPQPAESSSSQAQPGNPPSEHAQAQTNAMEM